MSAVNLSTIPTNVEVRELLLPGYPGYAVAADGEVWSCRCPGSIGGCCDTWRKLTGWINPRGYRMVAFHAGRGQKKNMLVSRCVLLGFCGACPRGHEARHLNGKLLDNRRGNLAWGTRAENVADKVRHGTILKGSAHPRAVLSPASVLEIRRRRLIGDGPRLLGREFGVNPNTIVHICKNRNWRCLLPITEA